MPTKSKRKKLSRLQIDDYIGISVGDLHLSDKTPVARKGDWKKTMVDHLQELNDIQKTLKVPVFCTGDVFHEYNPSPELINLTINNMCRMFGIPGNHDLYCHSTLDLNKTGYNVLMNAGLLEMIPYKSKLNYPIDQSPTIVETKNGFFNVFGFPFDHAVYELPKEKDGGTFGWSLAVIHSFIWKMNHGFKNASEESKVAKWRKKLVGYDFALFGDNHSGFITSTIKNGKKNNLCNTGAFIRRTIKEVKYQPFVGLIRKDGNIEKYYLESPNNDEFHKREKAKKLEKLNSESEGMNKFARELSFLKTTGINFEANLRAVLKRQNKYVRRIISEMITEVEDERKRNIKNG